MNYKPLNKNLIVERIKTESKSQNGIILSSSDEPDFALVIAVSNEVSEVVVGEKLLVNWNQAYELKGGLYKIDIDSVVAVYE